MTRSNLGIYLTLPMFFRFVDLPSFRKRARMRGEGKGMDARQRGERGEEKAIKVTSTAARRLGPGSPLRVLLGLVDIVTECHF